MANAPSNFDVWLVAADTVYKGVPYGVVTGWAEQGRLAADDKLRPANSNSAWVRAGDHPQVADFLFRPSAHATEDVTEQLHAVELDIPSRQKAVDEDDDVDMIPLIDISLVLLIFFMMTTAVAALSPISVPDMKHASEISKDRDAFTIQIDKRSNEEVVYSLRIGEGSPKPEDSNLTTVPAVIARLDVRLAEAQRPPEVRIACHKDLPRERVREVVRELEIRKAKNPPQIAFYGAEVNEKSKK